MIFFPWFFLLFLLAIIVLLTPLLASWGVGDVKNRALLIRKSKYDLTASAVRILVLRGIDDEAAMALSFGSIGERLAMMPVGVGTTLYNMLYSSMKLLLAMLAVVLSTTIGLYIVFGDHPYTLMPAMAAQNFLIVVFYTIMFATPIGLMLAGIFRSVYGASSCLVC